MPAPLPDSLTIPTQVWVQTLEQVQTFALVALAARRVPLTDPELAKQQPYLDAMKQALQRARALPEPWLDPSVLAQELADTPRYPRILLVEPLLPRLAVDQGVALCRALVEQQRGKLGLSNLSRCFEWLAAQPVPSVLPLLRRWLDEGLEPRWTVGALAQLLGFPMVGPLKDAALAHQDAPGPQAADCLARLLGLERQAETLHTETLRSLEAVQAAPELAVMVDLFGTRLRALPEVLLRCTALQYLKLEDDYFDEEAQRAIEAQLPGVSVEWTRGLYVDGRHGR